MTDQAAARGKNTPLASVTSPAGVESRVRVVN